MKKDWEENDEALDNLELGKTYIVKYVRGYT